MPNFFQKPGWLKLKKDHDLDDSDPCVSKMNTALKKFFGIDDKEINLTSIDEVGDAVDKFAKCMVKSADSQLKAEIAEMKTDAKKFRNGYKGAIDKGLDGFLQKSGWSTLKREHDLDDRDQCVVKINDALNTFYGISEDELSITDLEEVEGAVAAFDTCTKKTATAALKNMKSEMRGQVKTAVDALAAALKKGMA